MSKTLKDWIKNQQTTEKSAVLEPGKVNLVNLHVLQFIEGSA